MSVTDRNGAAGMEIKNIKNCALCKANATYFFKLNRAELLFVYWTRFEVAVMDGRNGRLIRCVIVQLIRAIGIINALAISPLNTKEGSPYFRSFIRLVCASNTAYTKKNDILLFNKCWDQNYCVIY